jgi:hypothetical protein
MDGSLVVRPQDGWSVLFAKEPEPDLEFDELGDDMQQAPSSGAPRPRPRRTSSRKPIHWVLFLLIVSIGGLFAYDPELAMDVLGLSTHQPAPPMTVRPVPKPRPSPPAQIAPASQPMGSPVASPPLAPAVPVPTSAPAPSMASSSGSTPLFMEGQRVVVIADPALPTQSVTLSPEPSGTKPGPAIPAGAMLIVMDGELHDGGWIYAVRTADGATGWLPEKRLRPQR